MICIAGLCSSLTVIGMVMSHLLLRSALLMVVLCTQRVVRSVDLRLLQIRLNPQMDWLVCIVVILITLMLLGYGLETQIGHQLHSGLPRAVLCMPLREQLAVSLFRTRQLVLLPIPMARTSIFRGVTRR